MTRIKKDFFTWKSILFAIPILLYSWSERQAIGYVEESYQVTANFWDHMLTPSNDIFLLIFYFFPLIIYLSTVYINRTFEYTVLLRIGSYRKWVWTKTLQLLKLDLFLLAIFVGTILLTSLNTPFSMQWSNVGTTYVPGYDVLYFLQSYFSTPYIAFVMQIGLLLLASLTIQFILCILYAIYKNPILLHVSNVGLLLYGVISFRVLPPSMNYFSILNYLSLIHGTIAFGSRAISYIVLITILLAMFSVTYMIDKNNRHLKTFVLRHGFLIIYGLLCILGIILNVRNYSHQNLAVLEVFSTTFFGTTNEMFSLVPFMYYVVVFIGFVYFIQLKLEKQLTQLSFYTMIRYKTMNKWLWSWFPNVLKWIVYLLLSLFMFTTIIALLSGHTITLSGDTIRILYHFFINGFLQILLYILLVTNVSLFTKDVFKSFLVLLGSTVFMLPGFQFNNIVPVGLNSMAYLFEGISEITISVWLIGYNLVAVLLMLYMLNKKDYSF